jgi:hypothetical protein
MASEQCAATWMRASIPRSATSAVADSDSPKKAISLAFFRSAACLANAADSPEASIQDSYQRAGRVLIPGRTTEGARQDFRRVRARSRKRVAMWCPLEGHVTSSTIEYHHGANLLVWVARYPSIGTLSSRCTWGA